MSIYYEHGNSMDNLFRIYSSLLFIALILIMSGAFAQQSTCTISACEFGGFTCKQKSDGIYRIIDSLSCKLPTDSEIKNAIVAERNWANFPSEYWLRKFDTDASVAGCRISARYGHDKFEYGSISVSGVVNNNPTESKYCSATPEPEPSQCSLATCQKIYGDKCEQVGNDVVYSIIPEKKINHDAITIDMSDTIKAWEKSNPSLNHVSTSRIFDGDYYYFVISYRSSSGETGQYTSGSKPIPYKGGTIEYKTFCSSKDPEGGNDGGNDGNDKPSEGGDNPSEGGDKPSEGGDKPSEGEDKPSEGGDKPSEGGGTGTGEGGDGKGLSKGDIQDAVKNALDERHDQNNKELGNLADDAKKIGNDLFNDGIDQLEKLLKVQELPIDEKKYTVVLDAPKQCPAPLRFRIDYLKRDFYFDFTFICDFVRKLGLLVIASAYVSAIYILLGLRRS